MRERPILFSAPMVRALLDGTKTQTRRVAMHTFCGVRVARLAADAAPELSTCPYGVPGDRLWVRETWQYADWTDDGQPYVRYAADDHVRFCEGAGEVESLVDIWCHLSSPDNYEIDGKAADRKWRPSIYMPRWASRLTLEITDVRVERLQRISEADAIAEGVSTWRDGWTSKERAEAFLQGSDARLACGEDSGTAKRLYYLLWQQINAARGYGWDANPWVWVVSFTPEVRRA